jgi:hypothetical protein
VVTMMKAEFWLAVCSRVLMCMLQTPWRLTRISLISDIEGWHDINPGKVNVKRPALYLRALKSDPHNAKC